MHLYSNFRPVSKDDITFRAPATAPPQPSLRPRVPGRLTWICAVASHDVASGNRYYESMINFVDGLITICLVIMPTLILGINFSDFYCRYVSM